MRAFYIGKDKKNRVECPIYTKRLAIKGFLKHIKEEYNE